MNKVILIGRVGKDPDVRETKSGTVSNFSVATTESWKDKSGEWKEKTEWHNVVLWRDVTFGKGDLVSIEGKLTTRSYENKDGETRYVTEVVASNARRLYGKSDSSYNKEIDEVSADDINEMPF